MIAYTLEAALAQPERTRTLVLYRRNMAHWPDAFFQLASLEHLELDQCQISHLDPRLARLPLRKLILPNNQLSVVPTWIRTMSHLESLDLSHNALTSWPEEAVPPRLQTLRLAHNRLRRLTVALIRDVIHLDLRSNPLSNHMWPEDMNALQQLALDGSPQAAAKFLHGYYPALTELLLKRCRLDRLPMEWSGRFPLLRHLDLQRNQLESLPTDFPGSTPLLRLVNLSHNRLTRLPPQWSSAVQLRELDLSANQLTRIPESLGQLPWITRLSVASNPLPNVPDILASLPRLEVLDLQKTALTDLPAGPWPALASLKIHQTPLAAHESVLRNLPARIRVSGKKKSVQPDAIHLSRFRHIAVKSGWDTERSSRIWALAGRAGGPGTSLPLQDHLDLWQLGHGNYPRALLGMARSRPASAGMRLAVFGRSWIPQVLLADRVSESGWALVKASTPADADLVLLAGPQGDARMLDARRQCWMDERALLSFLPPRIPGHTDMDPDQVRDMLRSPLPTYQMLGQKLLDEKGIPASLCGELLLIIRTKSLPILSKGWTRILIRWGEGEWVADCLAPLKTLTADIPSLARRWGADPAALQRWTGH